MLSGDEADATTPIAADVLRRVAQLDTVDAAVRAASDQVRGRPHRWRPHGLWQGHAGLALACSVADSTFPDGGFDTAGHQHLRRAVAAVERVPVSCGLSDGLGGVAVAADALSRDGGRYRRLSASILESLVPVVASRAEALLAAPPDGLPVSAFDVISGLTGVGRHLLGQLDQPRCADVVARLLSALVVLAGEVDGVARLHTPPEYIADTALRRSTPAGHVNLGLAHGVPGPLALLSIAALQDLVVDGQLDAVRRLADRLVDARIDDEWGVNWPTVVPLDAPPGVASTPSRAAWCYGAPGVARALWLAGRATGDGRYCELAVAGLLAVHRRPVATRHIDAPTFCHGVAGLQQITLRFAAESGVPEFVDAARRTHRQLLEAFEPSSLLGYRDVQPDGTRTDEPGLLVGGAGIALVLLAASTTVEPTWDATLLLS